MMQLTQLMDLDMTIDLTTLLITLANALIGLVFWQIRQLTNRVNIQNGRISKCESKQAGDIKEHLEHFHSK